MTIRNLILASAAMGAFATVPAHAQEAAPAAAAAPAASVTPTVGAQVFDAQGGSVGTIASVDGTNAVVDTGTNKAAIPYTGFAKNDKGLVMGMTKAELDAAASQASAGAKEAFKAKLAAGTPVVDKAGAPLGKIEANDGSLITLARSETNKMKLPIDAFGPTASGDGVQIGMTAAELDAAAKQAAPQTAQAATSQPQ